MSFGRWWGWEQPSSVEKIDLGALKIQADNLNYLRRIAEAKQETLDALSEGAQAIKVASHLLGMLEGTIAVLKRLAQGPELPLADRKDILELLTFISADLLSVQSKLPRS